MNNIARIKKEQHTDGYHAPDPLTPKVRLNGPSFSNDKKAVVTLGAFDGMHLGHQAVIKRVVELAHQHDAFSVVILFDPRPAFVHGWAASHHGEEPAVQNVDAEALTSVDDRLHRMEQFGVDHVLVVHYTLAFAAMSYIFLPWQTYRQAGHAYAGPRAGCRHGQGARR